MNHITTPLLQSVALRLLHARSVADSWSAGGGVAGAAVARPTLALGVALAAYVLWLPFGALFSLLAHAFTTPGVLLLSLLTLCLVGRWVCRLMVWPASLPMPAASMHREYAGRLRREVLGAVREAEARLLSLAALERRAAVLGGSSSSSSSTPPLSLPPSLATLLAEGTEQGVLLHALGAGGRTPAEQQAAALQPGPADALSFPSFLATLAHCADRDGDAETAGGGGSTPHAALLLHYGTAAAELHRCIESTIAQALKQPYLLRDRAGLRAVAARLLSLPVPPALAGADLLTGEHGLPAEAVAVMAALQAMPALELLLHPAPPCPCPGSIGQGARAAVQQALALGQGPGLGPLTVKQAMTACLACYGRVKTLSPWCEVRPHAGWGQGRAGRQVAQLAARTLGALGLGGCPAAADEAAVEDVCARLDRAWWQSKVPSWLWQRVVGGPAPPAAPAAAGAAAAAQGPAIAALLGLPMDAATAARTLVDAAAAGAPLPVEQEEGLEGQPTGPQQQQHPHAPILLPTPTPTAGQGQASSPSASRASEEALLQSRLSSSFGFIRPLLSVLGKAADQAWVALTLHAHATPVLGPAYLRAELVLRAGARMLSIPQAGLPGRSGRWRGKLPSLPCLLPASWRGGPHAPLPPSIDAVVIPSLDTLRAWKGVAAAAAAPAVIAQVQGKREEVEDPFASLTLPQPPGMPTAAPPPAPAAGTPDSGPSFSLHAPCIVLLCAPNAGQWEHALRHSEWVSVYGSGRVGREEGSSGVGVGLGYDVILWNYRGVGRSSGYPSLLGMWEDISSCVSWARSSSIHGPGGVKLVVQGESLGGLAACWVGSGQEPAARVDCVVADRTFASLPVIARSLMGGWAGVALSLLTGWTADNGRAWMQGGRAPMGAGASPTAVNADTDVPPVAAPTPTPRILLCDPHDQVIGWDSSLGRAVAVGRVHGVGAAGHGKGAAAARAKQAITGFATIAGEAAYDLGSALVRAGRGIGRRLRGSAVAGMGMGMAGQVGGGTGAGDHGSDAPEGETQGREGEAVPDTAAVPPPVAAPSPLPPATVAVVPEAPASPTRATFLSDYYTATAQLHYLLLHVARKTAVVFARPHMVSLAGKGRAGGGSEGGSGLPSPPRAGGDGEGAHGRGGVSLGSLPPQLLAGSTTPSTPPSSLQSSTSTPSHRALARVLTGRAIPPAALAPGSASYSTLMEECYGKHDGLWMEIAGAVLVSGAAVCQQAEVQVSQALSLAGGQAGAAAAGGVQRRDSEEYGTRMQGAVGAAALTTALAGATNGLGLRLGESCALGLGEGSTASALAATRAWVAAGLVWGWQAQQGMGPLAEIAQGVGVPPGYASFYQPSSGSHSVAALNPPVGLGRPVPYLECCRECGLDSCARRVGAMLVAAQAGVTGAGGQDIVPADVSLLQEALAVLSSLQRLRATWRALESTEQPQAATLAGVLRAPQGLCVPLACGHNAALASREISFVTKAVQAAVSSR